jgi:hypothetical protein
MGPVNSATAQPKASKLHAGRSWLQVLACHRMMLLPTLLEDKFQPVQPNLKPPYFVTAPFAGLSRSVPLASPPLVVITS